jgi:hypothetical protein
VTISAVRSGRSRTRAALLAALAAVGLLATGATASDEPEPGLLVVEGRGGTTAVVTVDLPPGEDQADPFSTVITGGGRYAGALVEALEPSGGRLGAVQVRAFGDATSDAVALVTASPWFRPGRYRVTLLGEGPVRVQWDLNGSAGLRVEPTAPLPVQFLGRSLPLPSGQVEDRIELPGALPAGKRAVLVLPDEGLRVVHKEACATTAGGECPDGPLLPACPTVGSCPTGDLELPVPASGEPQAGGTVVEAAPTVRSLLWTVEGYRDTPGKHRAAAVVLG